jgi:hypothetical protein
MWNIGGLALALLIAGIALVRSRARGGYYDAEVYHMVPSTHRRYAAVSLAFAFFFGTAAALGLQLAGMVALCFYAVVALFYLTSFLRGYADADE